MQVSLTILLLLSLLAPVASPPVQPEPVVQVAAKAQDAPTAVYLQYEDGFAPVMLFRDGESLICYYDDDNYSYSCFLGWISSFWQSNVLKQFQPFEEELAGEEFVCYKLLSQSREQTLSFQQLQKQLIKPLSSDERRRTVSPFVGLATNSDDPHFWADAQYSHYTAAEQADVPAIYTEYVRRKLNTAGLYHTPAIIQDLWEYDCDGDGQQEAIIFASNLPSEGTEKLAERSAITASPGFKQGLGHYTYILFYSETFLPMDLFKKTSFLWPEHFRRGDEQIYEFEEPLSYQFDEEGDIQAFRMWTPSANEDINRRPFLRTAICDFDQDGRYDFGIFYGAQDLVDDSGRLYLSAYQIYLQKAGSQFQYLNAHSFYDAI